ncbi:hypothetical protein DSO57_1008249 [Entomophthora muscae]|uniref:Uncharacterized protein n=1 Tax=Entomophthora muscae TaxID=34485 RepID=A0ACC2TI05_9FUNG|nr:hypothetical protein DSO57_1008249 [Entomophthora muscae]
MDWPINHLNNEINKKHGQADQWAAIKANVKRHICKESSQLMTAKKAYKQKITNTIQHLEANIPKQKNAGWTAAWQAACVKLARIEQNQSNLACLQAATSLAIKGKQPTKAFIAMYKIRCAQKSLSEVVDKGTSHTSKEGALSATHTFYSGLYASKRELNCAALQKWLERCQELLK